MSPARSDPLCQVPGQRRQLLPQPARGGVPQQIELARSTEEEKQSQLKRLADLHERNKRQSPEMLERLKRTVIDNGNVFEVLMEAVRVCSLGQIPNALLEVGGQYRRST
jgi:methylmalonyl-CoA mutase